jgi:hypothetical protein
MNHFLTVFYCSPILLKILQMMACCLSLRHPTCSLGHGKSAPQKGLTDSCEAFLHGKEHTTGQAFRPALILPLAVMLFVFHFSVH